MWRRVTCETFTDRAEENADDGGSTLLRNVGNFPPDYTASHNKILWCSYPSSSSFCQGNQGIQVRFPITQEDFPCPKRPDRQSRPPTLLSISYRGLFPSRIKQPEHEAKHPSASVSEVKKTSIYTSIPPYAFRASFLKHNHNLTLHFLRVLSLKFCTHRLSPASDLSTGKLWIQP